MISCCCVVVDFGDVKLVEVWLVVYFDWWLSDILVIYYYYDYVGGVVVLKELIGVWVFGLVNEKILVCDLVLEDGEWVEVFGLVFEIFYVFGYIFGYIVYYYLVEMLLLFCGDILFVVGCGCFFEGILV